MQSYRFGLSVDSSQYDLILKRGKCRGCGGKIRSLRAQFGGYFWTCKTLGLDCWHLTGKGKYMYEYVGGAATSKFAENILYSAFKANVATIGITTAQKLIQKVQSSKQRW